MKIKFKYKNFVAILFFIFFATPILSPSINGNTIYLHWFIPLLDFKFVQSIIKMKMKKKYLYQFLLLIMCMALFGEIMIIIKILFLVETILYLFYCRDNKTFSYLYLGVNVNIIIGVIQFILYYISPSLSYIIGPTNIAKMIWGEYATITYTNFFEIFRLVRVSGWSREAGFFASLITISFIIYIKDKEQKKGIIQYIFFAIGYAISFSKSSFIMIIMLFILLFEKQLRKIPYSICVLTTILVLIITSNYLEDKNLYVAANESLMHRMSGYSMIADLNIDELFFGVDKIENINEQALQKHNYLQYIYRFEEFCGIPNLIVHHGIIVFLIFIIGLRLIGFGTPEFLILTIVSITVEYFASTSFMVLGYYLCIYMIKQRKITEQDKLKIENKVKT